jgi:chromosome segregation ATPase
LGCAGRVGTNTRIHVTLSVLTAPLAALTLLLAGVVAPVAAQNAKGAQRQGPGDNIMTREELRSCLKQEDAVNARRRDIQARNGTLAGEKEELQRQAEALKGENQTIAQRNSAIRDLATRIRDHESRVQSWNQRVAKLDEAPRGDRERLQAELEAEKQGLQQSFEALTAENNRLSDGFTEAVAAYNARAQEHGQRLDGWNQRSAALAGEATAEQRQREDWRVACGNRRFREEDEAAIRSGK